MTQGQTKGTYVWSNNPRNVLRANGEFYFKEQVTMHACMHAARAGQSVAIAGERSSIVVLFGLTLFYAWPCFIERLA